jgi:GNAT superfamily N-acetyltransferase
MKIRDIQAHEYDTLYNLIKEFSIFIKTPEKVTTSAAKLYEDRESFCCKVVEVDKVIVGFASYYHAYSTWSGKIVYVDDLYIQPDHRNHNYGNLLLQEIISEARNRGCVKVYWQVSGWNEKAKAFYTRMGAKISDTEVNCVLELKD